MSVAQDEIARVVADFRHDDRADVQNIWHMKLTTASLSDADALDDILELLEALYALLTTAIHALTIFNRIRAINASQNSDIGIAVPADTTPFAGSGDAAPLQTAYGLTMQTAKINIRGRKFFGCPTEAHLSSGGIVQGPAITSLGNVGDYVTSSQAATNGTWQFGVKSSLDGLFYPFVGYAISTTAITQRSRRIGVGS